MGEPNQSAVSIESSTVQTLTILGSTGSIGQSTLDVINRHPDKFQVYALTTNTRVEVLIEQAKICRPQVLVVSNESALSQCQSLVRAAQLSCDVISGAEALCEVAKAPQVDTVMAAVVGAAGLMPTLAAVKAGKKVLLANKESLVMSGKLFIDAVAQYDSTLLPIDSEHNAIFQCMPSEYGYGRLEDSGIAKILLTGSGGPFLSRPINTLAQVTPDEACAHPNWSMGRKISVDSATMMNKGLEFIEACWLFGVKATDIEVVLHPQSIIHSMVQYTDGSVLAQMGNPDMRTPIAHALAYPHRIDSGVKPLDFADMLDFSFTQPNRARYPNLQLAIDAFSDGQSACTSLNAANEVAVEAFLQHKIAFTDIYKVNAEVLNRSELPAAEDIQQVLMLDEQARDTANTVINEVLAC